MNGFARLLSLLVLIAPALPAPADHAVFEAVQADADVPLTLDPASSFWKASRPVYMEQDSFGKPVPRYRTEVRTRWTKEHLYFLFICPYEELHLRPAPNAQKETNQL